jgi:hypothetical protein
MPYSAVTQPRPLLRRNVQVYFDYVAKQAIPIPGDVRSLLESGKAA